MDKLTDLNKRLHAPVQRFAASHRTALTVLAAVVAVAYLVAPGQS